nr:G-type lectin S-receptor-like serine/threonine-protein kinase At1g11410 [Ipomoea batatas]
MGRKTCDEFRTNVSLVVFLSFLVCLCSSTDTITFNQPLKDGDLLISNDSSYALGFFTPGNSIGKRYVGLWYQNIPEKVVVWVANRDNPVNGTSGILFIDTTGNLVIQDKETGNSVWNTSLSFEPTGTRDYSAQLKDTGNLVLYHDREKRVNKWQSFDYPTNTLIASMKLGVGKNKSLNWFLRSWKSPDDPGSGEYSVGIDLTGKPQAFLYKNSSSPVWRLGPWNGIRWSGVPQMTPEITPYAFTENDEEFSEEYWIRDPSSVYTIVMLNDSGTVNKIIWKGSGNGEKKWDGVWYYPNDECDHYGHCGAFGICDSAGFSCRCVSGFKPKSNQDLRQGCWRNQTEVCGNGEGFLKLEHMKIPDTEMAAVNTTIGLKECGELCLSNCSCTAYASANISDGGTGCVTWYGDLIDMREFTDGGQDMYVRVSASDLGIFISISQLISPNQTGMVKKILKRSWAVRII